MRAGNRLGIVTSAFRPHLTNFSLGYILSTPMKARKVRHGDTEHSYLRFGNHNCKDGKWLAKRPPRMKPSYRRWTVETLLDPVRTFLKEGPYRLCTPSCRMISAEEISNHFRAKIPIVLKAIRQLQTEGLVGRNKSNGAPHDSGRHHWSLGCRNSAWIATLYTVNWPPKGDPYVER